MADAITAGLASLKLAFDVSKTMLDVHGTVQVQAKVFELQREILAAQASAMEAMEDKRTLLDRVRSLEEEIRDLKKWEAGKDAYQLECVYPGAFAYVNQTKGEGAEPPHWLCVGCYDKGHRSLLQERGRDVRDQHKTVFACNGCKGEIRVRYTVKPGKPYEPD